MKKVEPSAPAGARQRALSHLGDASSDRTYTVGFLLPPRFILLSYAGAIEPLRAANTLSGRVLYEWKHITMDGEPVEALSGGTFRADYKVGDDVDLDLLIVCTPTNSVNFHDERTFRWLRQVARRGTTMASISGGVYLLARAGVLEGYRVAVHWEQNPAFREEFPNLEVSRSIYVMDRNRLTCGGGLSAIDLMHAMIEKRHGHELATDISEWFLHTEVREGREPQRLSLQARLGVNHPGLVRAIEAMERNLEEPIDRCELARIAGVSERHLDRLFLNQIGTTLSLHYLQLRLGRAHELIVQSSLSLLEIGLASGFNRASTFSKSYRKMFGVSPSSDRAEALRRWRKQPQT